MRDFTPEEDVRWTAWQTANHATAARSHNVMGLIWMILMGSSIVVLGIILGNLR